VDDYDAKFALSLQKTVRERPADLLTDFLLPPGWQFFARFSHCQSGKATDTITANTAASATGGAGGSGGGATAGIGQSNGTATPGQSGATDLFSVDIGVVVATFGTAQADNTTITDNHASTNDNNVDGTITP
jgi:hypothetical protein